MSTKHTLPSGYYADDSGHIVSTVEWQTDDLLCDLLDIASRVVSMLEHQGWLQDGTDPESALLRDARAAIYNAKGCAE